MRLLELIWTHDARLRELSEEIALRQTQVVAKQGEVPQYVYFPIDCVFSVLVWTSDGLSTEVAAIGNEGMVGMEGVMGGRMVAETVCQIPGRAIRLRASVFRAVWQENIDVRAAIDKYALALLGQFIQSAACNRLHSVEQRAARWLLSTMDRTDSTGFSLTHAFFAAMLGANRTTVTLTLRALDRDGLIRRRRTRVDIVDVLGLKQRSCECYETIRSHHEAALLP